MNKETLLHPSSISMIALTMWMTMITRSAQLASQRIQDFSSGCASTRCLLDDLSASFLASASSYFFFAASFLAALTTRRSLAAFFLSSLRVAASFFCWFFCMSASVCALLQMLGLDE